MEQCWKNTDREKKTEINLFEYHLFHHKSHIDWPAIKPGSLKSESSEQPCGDTVEAVKVKVKCTLVQAMRLCTGRTAHRGSGGISLPFLDHGTRRG